ncbi:MAG TPA: ABC transporter substrate-binding protein [Desulfopila sp.]|nr:ABC transporter substrate-binding protein [Desulfopila sp.]
MSIRVCSFYVIFVVLAFFGCSSESEDQEKSSSREAVTSAEIQRGGVYRLPLDIMPTTLDPPYIEDDFGISIAYQVYDGLVQYGPYLNVLPAIARDWQIEKQGRILRFHLRKEATFHDGEPVTAGDAVFSLQRLFRVDPAPSILSHLLYIAGSKEYRAKETDTISGLKAVNDHELEIELVEPYAPFLGALAMYQAAIVPEHIAKTQGETIRTSPVGSGPFKFAAWEPNDLIRLERYPLYYAGASYLDAIEYHIYPGAQRDQVLKDFESGLLEEMPVFGQARTSLAEKEALHWVHRPSLSLLFYGINTEHPPLQDSRLRRALSLAINRDDLLTEVYDNQFEAAYTVLPPGMPAHSRDVQEVKEDLTLARELVSQVAESNPSAPIKVEIVSASQSAFAQAEFKLIQERWASIGVDTSIRYITDWDAFEHYLQSDSMQIFRYSWTADMPDPDNFLRPLFESSSSVNYTGYSNKAVDALLTEAAATVDEIKRAGLYQRIEKKVMEEYPIIPLFYLSIDRVYQPWVNGISSSPLGWQAVRLHRTWLDSAAPQ